LDVINFIENRKIKMKYCNITIGENGKKKPDFGATWGAMKKKDANASFIQTGNGMYVIDIDSKKIPKKYKKWIQSLGSPTVETKNGYHFYVKSKAPVKNHQNIFNDDKFKVDIRGDGGVVFTGYWGNSKDVSYLKSGKILKDKKFKIFKTLPKSVREPKSKKKVIERSDVGKVSVNDAKKMLKQLDIKEYRDRDAWMAVLASFYHGCGSEGEKVARKWSKGDKKNYDEESFDNIWGQFKLGQYGEDISYGTLVHAVKGDYVEPTSMFKVEQGSVHPLSKKEKKKKVKEEKKKKKSFNPLSVGGELNDALLKERKNQKVLFESVVVERLHSFIFGSAGSNKTTVMAWIGANIAENHKDKIVHFFSFDASQDHENSIYKYIKKKKLTEQVMIYTGKTSEDYYTHYQMAIDTDADLSSLVIIIDTWKFITKDVNSKGANKEAMHFIKQLLALGATVVSLGHTNKDNIKNSGTAEIEQDSDAILRIDRNVDEFGGDVTLTISSAGRTRFNCEGVSLKSSPTGSNYDYLYSAINTMRVLNEVVDLSDQSDDKSEEKKKEKEVKSKKKLKEIDDEDYIKEIRRIIKDIEKSDNKMYKPLQSTIEADANSQEGMSRKLVQRLLRDYSNVHWKWERYSHKNGGKPTKKYKLIKGGK
jgi:hypothetical protein